MDIEIVATGRRFMQVDPTLAAILIEILPEAVRRVEKAAPPALPTCWTYFCGPTYFGAVAVQRKKGAATEVLSVNPDDVKKHWPDCPDSVISLYKATPPGNRVQCG
jgi:hypothetical protein